MAGKKQESVFVGERTPENFLACVAGLIETQFGQDCELYPSIDNAKGVSFAGVEIEVKVEFKAGRPYVNIDDQDIVRGLSDINVAAKRTAEAAYYAMPKARATAARKAQQEAQEKSIEEVNASMKDGEKQLVWLSERYNGYDAEGHKKLSKLRINCLGISADTELTEMSEKQLAKLRKLHKQWAKAYADMSEFFESLKAKVEKTESYD